MGLTLYSRQVQIGNRVTTVHEVLESELSVYRMWAWFGPVAGFFFGLLCGAAYVFWRWHATL